MKVNWNQLKVNWNQLKVNWNQLKVNWFQLKVNWNQFKKIVEGGGAQKNGQLLSRLKLFGGGPHTNQSTTLMGF